MASVVEMTDLSRGRRWTISSSVGGARLTGLRLRLDGAGDEVRRLRLTRNDARRGGSGDCVWTGRLTNTGGETLGDLIVELRFVDAQGWGVRNLLERRRHLAAGKDLSMETVLPHDAAAVQVVAIGWRTEDARLELGPWEAWDFGYVQA
jgi:hypothetical protein